MVVFSPGSVKIPRDINLRATNMSEKDASHFWRNVGGVLIGVAALVTAGVGVYQVTKEDGGTTTPVTTPITTSEPPPKCDEPWLWDRERLTCVRHLTIPPKALSVSLDRVISEVNGRIDFYLNTKRLPGTDSQGRAQYEKAVGAVQVVIPIMQGTRMVGDTREVIFSTNDGQVCSIASLSEATGHMKDMRVSYFIRLAQCGRLCSASLESTGRRVHIETSEFVATVAKSC